MRVYCLVLLLLSGLLNGCASPTNKFEIKNLAKSDIDLVADLHRRTVTLMLQELNTKLYKLNPAELNKVPAETIDSRWSSLSSSASAPLKFAELKYLGGIDAMRLAFDDQYTGDRIFALMAGLVDMLNEAYGYKQEFYWLDSIDQQKLYNSARNIEVLVWLLRTKQTPDGNLMILTNSINEEYSNLSFERLFGKLIASQDMMAQIMRGKTQRAINTVAHGIVSMTFIPL